MRLSSFAAALFGLCAAHHVLAQVPATPPRAVDTVREIASPRLPLPPESTSAGITRFSFIAYGDTRGAFDGQLQQSDHRMVVESILQTITSMELGPDPVRFIVWSGDAVQDGRVALQWNVSFVDLVSRLTQGAGIPFYPVPGNHEIAHTSDLAAPGRIAGLRNYYSAFRNAIPPEGSPRRLVGYPTYAIGYGNTFVLFWDSSIAADSTQYEWIKAQLEELDRRRYVNIVVVAHHPALSSGPHGGSLVEPQTASIRQRFMPLFRQQHVKLMFAGHEHLLDHWVERYRGSNGRQYRLDQVVSGGGGAPLYGYRGEPDLTQYLAAGAPDSLRVEHLVKPGQEPGENPYHYVVVHVDGDRIRLEIVGVGIGRGYAPYRSNTVRLSDSLVAH